MKSMDFLFFGSKIITIIFIFNDFNHKNTYVSCTLQYLECYLYRHLRDKNRQVDAKTKF
jgi:hypothetical protein